MHTAIANGQEGPLTGVRILDVSSVIMGPFATQVLGDLGAEVIAIEAPWGDINRLMDDGPCPGLSGVALNLLRNKRNVALNIKSEAGRHALLQIARTCDVFVTNLRPANLERLGLTYDDIREVRTDIIYCQAHGYPSSSEDANRPAYDDVIQAVSGVADAFILSGNVPQFAPTILADKISALTIVYAVCAALFRRCRTGAAERVEVPMADVMRSFMLVEHGSGAIPMPPTGSIGYSRVLAEHRRPFKTQDGWICILPYSTDAWNVLMEMAGRKDVIDGDMAKSRSAIIKNANELYAILETLVATRTTRFWTSFCDEHCIPAGRVVSLAEIVPQLPLAEHPVAGRYRQIPNPVHFSGGCPGVRRHAPMLGENTAEVMAEAGISQSEIERASGRPFDLGGAVSE